jgi:hypothetical protein
MRIVYVVGARPNFVKMAPVISELRRRIPDGRHALIHTGQHYDRLMSDIFLEELGVPSPDHMLGVGSASHAVQTARVMERIEPVLEAERPDLVIVPGDVNSTLAATLVAVKLGTPVAHLEAGLRSFDHRPAPRSERLGETMAMLPCRGAPPSPVALRGARLTAIPDVYWEHAIRSSDSGAGYRRARANPATSGAAGDRALPPSRPATVRAGGR